ncbi:hypothetical protein I3760_08G171400 [Carya illinoinensis]|nr:hypothetical protein I3760_08G171400 [Carya illinoinensis]
MGLCLGSPAHQPDPTTATSPPTPGTSSSKNIESSAISSSNGKSQFSSAISSSNGKSQFSGVSRSSEESYPNGKILETPNLKEFSFSDLKTATKNFKTDSLLGEGGFGKVFKGWMDGKTLTPSKFGTGMVVAIKKLKSESMQGFQEWQDYNAKISDFGLAKLGPSGGDSHVTTRIMGTYGYAAPEYIATGHLYVKSDVYGFGVVLLELLTGLRALDTKRPSGQQSLVEWLKPSLSNKRKLKSIMDTRMEGQYTPMAATQAAELALKCLASEPKSRPSMEEVAAALERIEARKGKPKDSKIESTAAAHGQQPIHRRSPFHAGHHGAGI